MPRRADRGQDEGQRGRVAENHVAVISSYYVDNVYEVLEPGHGPCSLPGLLSAQQAKEKGLPVKAGQEIRAWSEQCLGPPRVPCT